MKETGHEEVRRKLSKLGILGLTRDKQSVLRILIKQMKITITSFASNNSPYIALSDLSPDLQTSNHLIVFRYWRL